METYAATVVPEMKKRFGYANDLAVPRIVKVVVSSGVGSIRDNKERLNHIEQSLARITGQKAALRPAKQSIASFKVRQGAASGYLGTLRGRRMNDFLERLVRVALPRIRDFRGISPTSIDEMGNLTIGIRDHTIFPETSEEDVRTAFGLGVTVVTNAKTRGEARALFDLLGFPLAKE